MCELFAMSSRIPAEVTFSLDVFAGHSEGERPNRDGWGVAFYDGGDARLLREPHPASESPWVKFIEKQGPTSTLVLSHIRHASTGSRTLANTHPFSRHLGGSLHCFAHNGNVKNIFENKAFSTGVRRPVGDTDSEYAFCVLLERLSLIWRETQPPPFEMRYQIVSQFAKDLKSLGLANFLYSDSEYLFAHGDRRRQTDGLFAAPGLHVLNRRCKGEDYRSNKSGVAINTVDQNAILVASVPLSDEAWQPVAENELIAVRLGKVVRASRNVVTNE